MPERTVAAGAGFAGDRTEPAVALAASGKVHAIGLECLAERTIVPGLRARKADPEAGHDPRLERRLTPLLPVAAANHCRVISNLGAANPRAAGAKIARLAGEIGCSGLRSAAVCRYSTRVDLPAAITRTAQVRFSMPQLGVSGAQTPGT